MKTREVTLDLRDQQLLHEDRSESGGTMWPDEERWPNGLPGDYGLRAERYWLGIQRTTEAVQVRTDPPLMLEFAACVEKKDVEGRLFWSPLESPMVDQILLAWALTVPLKEASDES